MTLFPANPSEGELYAADNGKNYVYSSERNVWESTDVIPKWSDQVYIRNRANETQQTVNDRFAVTTADVAGIAAQANQLVDVAFEVRTRGVWQFQGGAVMPDDLPIAEGRFVLKDEAGEKTQDYDKVHCVMMHAIGSGEFDRITIGVTEIGDMLTIQNSNDLQGGSYTVTGIEEIGNQNLDDLSDSYACYQVTPIEGRIQGSVSTDEMASIRIFPRAAQTATPDFDPNDYVEKSGSTMTGALQVTRPGVTAAGQYVFSVKSDALGDKPVSFRVTADGGVKAGHDTSHPFMATANNDVVTKKYLDQQIAAIPEPEIPDPVASGPTTKYDGNRYCVGSDRGTALNSGEVRFMSNDGSNVTNIASIQRVGLPASEFDWTKCTKSGVLKVKDGATVVGWLQVYDVDTVGSDKELRVKILQAGDTNVVQIDSGTPCYFHGVFFD